MLAMHVIAGAPRAKENRPVFEDVQLSGCSPAVPCLLHEYLIIGHWQLRTQAKNEIGYFYRLRKPDDGSLRECVYFKDGPQQNILIQELEGADRAGASAALRTDLECADASPIQVGDGNGNAGDDHGPVTVRSQGGVVHVLVPKNKDRKVAGSERKTRNSKSWVKQHLQSRRESGRTNVRPPLKFVRVMRVPDFLRSGKEPRRSLDWSGALSNCRRSNPRTSKDRR